MTNSLLIIVACICSTIASEPVNLPSPSNDVSAWNSLSYDSKTRIANHNKKFFLDDSGRLWSSDRALGNGPLYWSCVDLGLIFNPSEKAFDLYNVMVLTNSAVVKKRLDSVATDTTPSAVHITITGYSDTDFDLVYGNVFFADKSSEPIAFRLDSFMSDMEVSTGDRLHLDFPLEVVDSHKRVTWQGGKRTSEWMDLVRIGFNDKLAEDYPSRPLEPNAFPPLTEKQLAAELKKRSLKHIPVPGIDIETLQPVMKLHPIEWPEN